MANDIKQKIVLEGEKEYNRALSEAKRNLKTLRSELKAETAELGSNATAQQKNETRIKSLQKQIKEQEKIVKTYQDALKEVKTKYADNEDAVAKWEQKLNEARASLANMKNSLDDVGDGFKDIENNASMATVATKSVADTLEKLSGIGETISSGIESAFKGLISTAKDAITTIWGDITDLAARSNSLVDLAGFWNTDAANIQKYAYAVAFASGNLEDLNALVTKIVLAADKDKKGVLAGVSLENYNDQWDYAMAVMDALHQMDADNRRKTAEDIFGKSFTKALDLLNDWDAVLENLEWGETDVYGMSNEEIQQMSALFDKINGIEASWKYLKDNATVKLFGDLAFNITTNAQQILDWLMIYMNADSKEERDKAIKAIETNITEMFETAKKAIEDGIKLLDQIAEDLKSSDNPTAQALGNILGGLVDALKWFTADNMSNVVKSLELLAAFWLTGRGLQLGAKIAAIAQNIRTIQLFKTLGNLSGGGGLGAAASAGAGAATSVTDAVTAAIKNSAGTLAAVFTKFTISAAIVTMAVPVMAALADVIAGKWPEWLGADPRKVEKIEEQLGTKDESIVEKIEKASSDNGKAALHKLLGDTGAEVTTEGGKNFFQKVWDGYNDFLQQGQQRLDRINELLKKAEESAAELEEQTTPYTPEGGPDENWNYPDWWTMEEILEDMNRRTQKPDGGNSGNTDGLTSTDAQSMTSAMKQVPGAVMRGVSGIRVQMDGATVGRLVAPYVSQYIAEGIQ